MRKITCGTPSNCTAGTSGAVVTVYVYDAMGNLAAEYGPINDPGTRFVFTDALGSTRLTTDAAGNSVRRYNYAPFGEELTPAWTNWRTTAAGYGAVDSFPPKFTGKERDGETGLDCFGARYFSGAQGRFTSPDPLLNSGRLWLPQSWNRYAYALNNPLRFTDPTGQMGQRGQTHFPEPANLSEPSASVPRWELQQNQRTRETAPPISMVAALCWPPEPTRFLPRPCRAIARGGPHSADWGDGRAG